MQLLATCAHGLEDVLERELKTLEFSGVNAKRGGVSFTGEARDLYRSNLVLRTAGRILWVVHRSKIESDVEIESRVMAQPWRSLVRPERGILIELHHSGLPLPRVVDRANRLEERLLRKLETRRGRSPVRLIVRFHRGLLSIGIDTTGKALHKRGYRSRGSHEAPLQETLAAGLILSTGYLGDEPFWDPMTGSGTIAIEAASIALNKAPLIHRKKGEFAFEWLPGFDYALWRAIQDETRAEKRTDLCSPVMMSELDSARLDGAIDHGKRARVGHHLSVFRGSFLETRLNLEKGVLVMNPPYGIRIDDKRSVARLYRDMGRVLRERFSGWRGGVIVPDDRAAEELGFELDGCRRIRNGGISCVFVEVK